MRARRIVLASLLVAACGGTAEQNFANTLTFLTPAADTRFAPPSTRTFDVKVSVADTACAGSEVIDVSAGTFAERGRPDTLFAIPFAQAVSTIAAPDADTEVTITAKLSCGGDALTTTTTKILVREATFAKTIDGLDGTKIATLEYDSRGAVYSLDDGSEVGLLGPDFQIVRRVTTATAGFAGTAPDRRLTTCGPATQTGVPYCAYSSGGEDAEQHEFVAGVMSAAGPQWKANLNRANFGSAVPIAALVNGGQSYAYVVSPNKRIRAVADGAGVRWDNPFSDLTLQPGDAQLRVISGGLRALVRPAAGLLVRDFSSDGIGGAVIEFPSQHRTLDFAFTGQRFAWSLDERALRFLDLEGGPCTFDLPADQTLVELAPGRHAIVGAAANGLRVAAFLATQTEAGVVTEHLVTLDSQCTKRSIANPGGESALRGRRVGVAIANDGTTFLFAGAARVYAADLTLVRETSPALALGAPTVLCDQNICAKDDAGRIVALPIAPGGELP